jgi:hypothetical protein
MLNILQLQAIARTLEINPNTMSVSVLEGDFFITFTISLATWRTAWILKWPTDKMNATISDHVSEAIGFPVRVKLSTTLTSVDLKIKFN